MCMEGGMKLLTPNASHPLKDDASAQELSHSQGTGGSTAERYGTVRAVQLKGTMQYGPMQQSAQQ